ncbi:uncharacterized protein LOC117787619 isoform X2 [Drosophila innubila]|uniref:uncharacterized protein LOC117787619 isoform X2 n=1 Tax=Drosophila innubila TaxID=198719 RepID=UPI00148D4CA2|nr:uncharacterized protein LOC117787619 isoform X2 [Drosophila innubila]
MLNKLNVLFFRDSSTLQRHQHQQQQFQMAPSVCETSPKLPPHNAAGGQTQTQTQTQSQTQISNPASALSSVKCGASSLNGSLASYKMAGSEQSWPQAPVYSKENQRPPVYNPEDYVQSLRKFTKGSGASKVQSIYDVNINGNSNNKEDVYKAATLPAKHSGYKSPIPAPPESDSEMSLRQFGSITDLLTKLRADLRVSFPSFVQEFVATPSDGISHLLEVLRAIQMAQASNAPAPLAGGTNSLAMSRNPQSYQRRALLDELSCLQCLSICCSRSLDAIARLGNTPVGLMPLASSATGQGIRGRILALQLLASACDRQPFGQGNGGQKISAAGHTAVSEAMSTLRLRCSEPVRFRLLIGILNSGGGSGELQCAGIKFLNTFIESAVSLQQRLYIQAELFQAGLETSTLARTISSSSPWLDALRGEIKRFNELHIDVDKMLAQARDADRVRSQMVILERRVQILHEEKTVLTSMERRLQERCAELQREIFRLQGAQESGFKPVESHQPVALPRQVPPTSTLPGGSKQSCSEHEDEGISSSETGASLSPVPILVLPSKTKHHKQSRKSKLEEDDDDAATIEDVIEELDNIVSEAEKQISSQASSQVKSHQRAVEQEQDIVPVNIVPQPPRKSRSLAHLVPRTDCSEQEGSQYGMLMLHPSGDSTAVERLAAMQTFFDEVDYNATDGDQHQSYVMDVPSPDMPETEANTTATAYNASINRELLDVIMNARHDEHDPTMLALRNSTQNAVQVERQSFTKPAAPAPPAQHFNGVFFMTGMNTPQKYPKPDLTAALQARRVTKNVERLEAAFASSTHDPSQDANMVREKSRSNQQIYFSSNPAMRMHDYPATAQISGNASARTRSYTQGSKVTDLPSGLY